MKFILNLILIYCLIISQAFGQATNPNDVLKLGDKSSSLDKGITFETGDGVSNKKLLVEKISKKLKWNGNSVQIGDGSASSDKEIVIAGALKSLKYNGTSGEFEFNDDVKLIGSLKTDILQAINSEVDVKNSLRAELGVKFGTGNAEIKYDTGLNSLVFSNDGTLYKKVGSGSGGGDGGVSILKNGSFEDGSMNWTNSGGTYVVENYTNGTESDLKYAKFTATSASQTLCSDLATTPSYFGAGGMIDFTYTGTGTAFLAYVLDSVGNKLTAPQALLNQTAWTKLSPIPFSFNTSQKLCFESVGAGEIKIDKAYLGSNKNVTSISQANRVYKGYWPQMSGCSVSHDSATLSSFSTTAACPAITTEIADGVSPDYTDFNTFTKFTIGNLKPGKYIVRWHFSYYNNASANYNYFAITDGSYIGQESNANYLSDASFRYGEVESTFTYSTQQSSKTFELLGKDTASPILYLHLDYAPSYVTVDYYPNASDQVQTTEASQWFIDANIGGANPSISNYISSYSEITNGSLDLVLNTGSSQAQIACASGTDSTGLTCSSNESLGITFQNPYSGYYEACFDYTASTFLGANSNAVFQVVQTSPLSSVIVQEGKSRIMSGGTSNSYTTNVSNPNRLCGTFLFNDTSRKTIRLMYEADVATNMVIIGDRSSAQGQRDIHITVRPLLQNSLRAILTGDQVTSKNKSKVHLFSLLYGQSGSLGASCTSSPCGVSSIGDEAISVTRLSTGSYRVFLDKTYSKVSCTYIGYSSTSSMILMGRSDTDLLGCENSCSYINVYSYNSSSTLTDGNGRMICHAIE